jgi:hypothetical protein
VAVAAQTILSVVAVATGFGFSFFSSAVAAAETAMESVFSTTMAVAAVVVARITAVVAGFGFLSSLLSVAVAETITAVAANTY